MSSNNGNKLEKGYVQVYTGNGKGKTTAAMGLAFRSLGAGLKTYFGQFMKGQKYSELEAARMSAPYITMEQYGEPTFIHIQGASETTREKAKAGVQRAKEVIASGQYDTVVLDEICTAHHFGLVSTEEILDIMRERPENLELILTGRYASPEVSEAADLVTEMVEVKHYFQQGVLERTGIER
ncbi:MAG: cob(I)yrinic acid a,c-diamide adenosyltransferase [Chloroflexota bacterium]